MSICLEKALNILDKAKRKANELGASMSFAIFNCEHDLILFQKMDNCDGLSAKLAQAKAITALKINNYTENVSYLVLKNEGVLCGIRYDTSISLIGGGKIIYENGLKVGAIGVSGGSEEEDVTVAAAALSNDPTNS